MRCTTWPHGDSVDGSSNRLGASLASMLNPYRLPSRSCPKFISKEISETLRQLKGSVVSSDLSVILRSLIRICNVFAPRNPEITTIDIPSIPASFDFISGRVEPMRSMDVTHD